MLPKNIRLVRGDIPYILKEGSRFSTDGLILYLLKNKENFDSKTSKFSFSVSKKVAPTATKRNLYRRRGYSVIYKNLNKIKAGYCMFFVFKKTLKSSKYENLEDEILRLLSLAGVII